MRTNNARAILVLLLASVAIAASRLGAQEYDAGGMVTKADLEERNAYFAKRKQEVFRAKPIMREKQAYLVLEDGTEIKVARTGGIGTRTLARALKSKSGDWMYALVRKQADGVLLYEIGADLPMTDEERKEAGADRVQKEIGLLIETSKQAAREFAFKPDVFCVPRGYVAIEGQEAILETAANPQDSAGAGKVKTVVGHIAPAETGRHYPSKPMALYRQSVTVTFDSAQAAQAAFLRPLPIYHGHLYACANRFDDNDSVNDLRVAAAGSKVGVFGTCFLNGIGFGATNYNTRWKDVTGDDMRAIVAAGYSIGNHSQNHNMTGRLGELPNHEQFWEVYLPRAEREAQGDCLIMAVAPPHATFGTADTIENWVNAGNYCFCGSLPRGSRTENVVVNRFEGKDLLLIAATFHARGLGSEQALQDGVDLWTPIGKDPNVWKANWNQYGAYRYQYFYTAIRKSVEAKTATFTIYRPELVDLNDAIPLTFEVAAVGKATIGEITVENGSHVALHALPLDPTPRSYYFDLYHSPAQFLPEKIGFLNNDRKQTSLADIREDLDFPGIRATLLMVGNGLTFTLANRSSQDISDMALTYRLPNGWVQPVTRIREAKAIPKGSGWSDTLTVTPPADQKLMEGNLTIAAQLDFKLAGRPSRIHVMTSHK